MDGQNDRLITWGEHLRLLTEGRIFELSLILQYYSAEDIAACLKRYRFDNRKIPHSRDRTESPYDEDYKLDKLLKLLEVKE
jgi:hypothetical protein